MSDPHPLPLVLTIGSDDAGTAGIPSEPSREVAPLLPAAQALAQRIEKSRLDRAHQIAQLLGDMAAQPKRSVECDPKNAELAGPLTKRKARALKADDAPLSANL